MLVVVHGQVKSVDQLQHDQQVRREGNVLLIKLLSLQKPDNDFNLLVFQSLVEVFGEFFNVPMLVDAIVGILRVFWEEDQMVEEVYVNYVDDDLFFVELALVQLLGVKGV